MDFSLTDNAIACDRGLVRPAESNHRLIADLYEMLIDEITTSEYSLQERTMLCDPVYFYGRFLDPASRSYALQNAISNLTIAVEYLESGSQSKTIIDLGCGLGMQSIIFAARGWDVIGIDINEACVRLCEKRKTYYENRLQRELNIRFVTTDFRTPSELLGGQKQGALFSMSAFAHIQPLDETVARVAGMLSENGRVLLWDQNPGYLFLDRLGKNRERLPQPEKICYALSAHGFTTEVLTGACAVPRHFWRSERLEPAASRLNAALKNNLRLSFTYLLGASRVGCALAKEPGVA